MILRQKKRRKISFWLVLVGLCFFFNPNIAMVDPLPDVIGCFLICVALTRISHVSPVMQEARTKFLKLSAICAGKDILILTVLGSSAANEKATSLLLIAFSASLLFLWFAIGAFRALFDGFYGLSVLEECPPLYVEREAGKRCRTEAVLRYALFFLFLREILNLLPEFSSLSNSSDNLNPHYINLYEYIGVMRLLAAFVLLIFGVIYLVKIVRYFRLLQKQTDFLEKLTEKERTFAEKHPGNAVTRRYALSFLLMGIGGVLLTDFYLDFANILPDALATLFLISGLLLTDLPRDQKLLAGVGSLLYGVTATLSSYFAESFYADFANVQIGKNPMADRAYRFMWISSLVEMLLFLGLLIILLLFLRRIIDKWGGYLATQEDSAFETRRRSDFLEEFDGELIRIFVFGFLAALFSFVYDYMKVLPAIKWLRFLEFFWAFDFCMSLLFGVMFCVLLGNIFAAIKQRFMFD